jgi:hypothetical protein
LSRRLSILSTDRMAIFFFVHRHLSQTRTNIKLVQTHHLCLQDLLQPQSVSQNQLAYFSLRISKASCRSAHCPNTSLVSSGPTPNFNLPILLISLCLSPGKLSESSIVQTPHLCLQDSLPTSACRDILNAHLQASCRSLHLSKHLTCVSRTHSQLQPVEIYSSTSQKTCRLRQSIDKSHLSNDLTANMPKMEVKQKHVIWIKNTKALRCPLLYISNVPT